MTALNCFIISSNLRIRCRLLLNVCLLRDAPGGILLVESQLRRLVLLVLLLQSADFTVCLYYTIGAYIGNALNLSINGYKNGIGKARTRTDKHHDKHICSRFKIP